MKEGTIAKTVEIKLGNATYQVERSFVGKHDLKDILITKLLENQSVKPQLKGAAANGKQKRSSR